MNGSELAERGFEAPVEFDPTTVYQTVYGYPGLPGTDYRGKVVRMCGDFCVDVSPWIWSCSGVDLPDVSLATFRRDSRLARPVPVL